MVPTPRPSLNLVSNGTLRMHGRHISILRSRPYARSLRTYQAGRPRSREQGNLHLNLCREDSLDSRRVLYQDNRSGMGRTLRAQEAAQTSTRWMVHLSTVEMLPLVKVGVMCLCEGLRIGTSQVHCAAGDCVPQLCEHRHSDIAGCCDRHATGGSISGLLPRLSDQQLNVSQSINNTGNVCHPFSPCFTYVHRHLYRCSRNFQSAMLIAADVVESIRYKLASGGRTVSCSGSRAPSANSSLHRCVLTRSSSLAAQAAVPVAAQ
jgi:hypothetical protein